MIRLISWNVNGLRAVDRKEALKAFLDTYKPDIFFIQEIKAKPEQLEYLKEKFADYDQYYHAAEKPGYAGTGVWVNKKIKNLESRMEFQSGFPEHFEYQENEGRISRLDINLSVAYNAEAIPFSLLGVYFPNGGKSEAAWKDKLVFYDKFLEYINEIQAGGRQVIWCGDVNCAHNEIDLTRPKENKKSIGFLPEERAWISKCVSEGWVDIFRDTYPEKVMYSWWHLISRARSRNVGWRIDYFFTHESFKDHVQKIEYLNDQMGSDHCPVMMEI